jgi:hypothetical protein
MTEPAIFCEDSGDTDCVYDVSVTGDESKTFISFRVKGINSFGNSSNEKK